MVWHCLTSYFNLHDFLSNRNHLAGPLSMIVSGSIGSLLKLTPSVVEMAKNLRKIQCEDLWAAAESRSLNCRCHTNPAAQYSHTRAQGGKEWSSLLLAVKLISLDINLSLCEPGVRIIQWPLLVITWPLGRKPWVGCIDEEIRLGTGNCGKQWRFHISNQVAWRE